MEAKRIFFIIIVILIAYIILSRIFNNTTVLSSTIVNAQDMITISPSTLTNTSNSNPSNFTYSIWFYINDWNYRYGEPKVLFGRMGNNSSGTTGSLSGISGMDPCPAVVFGALENNISISLSCFPGSSMTPTTATSTATSTSTSTSTATSNSTGTTDPNSTTTNNATVPIAPSKSIVHTCNVSNIPIQKWTNLLVSVYGRTLDVYIDGKLVKTCLLPGVANVNQSAPVYITPKGGFSGFTSRMQYWPNATDPQAAYNVYAKGYGNSWLSFLGGYSVQVSVTKNGITETSVQV
jgi:hypothetical protein